MGENTKRTRNAGWCAEIEGGVCNARTTPARDTHRNIVTVADVIICLCQPDIFLLEIHHTNHNGHCPHHRKA